MNDITLEVTIPGALVAQATEGFLYMHPQPDEGPDSELTQKQWAERVLRRYFRHQCQRGLQLQARHAVPKPETDFAPE